MKRVKQTIFPIFSLLFCGFIIYIYFFSFISMVRCLVGFAHSVLLKNGNECTKKTTTDTHKHTEYECFKSILFISIWRTIFFCIFFSFVRSDVLRRSKKKQTLTIPTHRFFLSFTYTQCSQLGWKLHGKKMMWLNVAISTKWKWIASIKNRSHRARQHTCKKSYETCMQKDRCHKTFPSIFRQKERETFSFSLSVVRKKRIKLTTDLNCYVRGR